MKRLVLDTRDGVAALEYGYVGGDRSRLAGAVNAWLGKGPAAPGPSV